MRFVISKKCGSPWMTTHWASTPAPRAYARRVRSISATPPPDAVELTFSTTRPASSSRAALAVSSNRSARSAPISGSNRSGASAATWTSSRFIDLRSCCDRDTPLDDGASGLPIRHGEVPAHGRGPVLDVVQPATVLARRRESLAVVGHPDDHVRTHFDGDVHM